MLRRVLPLVVVLVALWTPSLALAGTATADVGSGLPVRYIAEPGEANDVVVTKDSAGVTITDSGATVTAGEGCTSVAANQAFCPVSRRRGVWLTLGDMDDHALVRGWFSLPRLEGGEGSDTLIDGGGAGDLLGGPGNDTLRGRWGDDRLFGGTGSDLMVGGNGQDEASYYDRTDPVTVDLDGVADDGEPGENDDLQEIENVFGGEGDDMLIGDNGPNSLWGGLGEDLIHGRGGSDFVNGLQHDDQLYGGPGDDRVSGSGGDDVLHGGSGPDELEGEGGSDVLAGDRGQDRLRGGPGNETIRARDGFRDIVSGGMGSDRARIDRRLDRVFSIESLL